jgi:hypothetical protein
VNENEFLLELQTSFPELKPIVLEHSSFYDATLFHLLIADFVRWAESGASAPTERARVSEFLAWLDAVYVKGDAEVTNAIDVSFVENIDARGPLPSLLGPRLHEVAKEMFPQTYS